MAERHSRRKATHVMALRKQEGLGRQHMLPPSGLSLPIIPSEYESIKDNPPVWLEPSGSNNFQMTRPTKLGTKVSTHKPRQERDLYPNHNTY